MIRRVRIQDAADIVAIYNRYIAETTVTFEIEPISVCEMQKRISDIASSFPYFVYEDEGRVADMPMYIDGRSVLPMLTPSKPPSISILTYAIRV